MKTPWRERTRDCVTSARFLIYALLLFSVFVQTRQQHSKEIKSKWDNRLLPTNSVYEQPQDSAVPPAENVPSIRSNNEKTRVDVDRSSSIENVEEDEFIYEDDYEIEEPEAGTSKGPSNVKLTAEHTRDSAINQEDAYYYYDDYENVTSPENEARDKALVEYVESSEEREDRSSSEKHDEIAKVSLETSSSSALAISRPAIEEFPVGEERSSKLELSPPDKTSLSEESDGQILIGEAVVSVVTTKSVVNGTISVPVSPLPMTTEQMLAPIIPSSTPNPGINYSTVFDSTDAIETTEDSRIVASVQTSRSISGARFLPFLVVEGVDKNSSDDETDATSKNQWSPNSEVTTLTKSLIEKSGTVVEKTSSDEEKQASSVLSTSKKTSLPPESTESIIDKLDRVQSELSSGFLAGGFRTSGNTLQLDVLGEQRPQQTRKSYTTTSRTPVISKFVPRRYNQERKAATNSATTPSAPGKNVQTFPSTDQQDSSNNLTEKIKFRWPSASRNSRPTSSTTETHFGTKNNIRPFGLNSPVKSKTSAPPLATSTVQDITAFLPPGYQLNKEDGAVTEKSILIDILAKSKFDISALLPANYDSKVIVEADEPNQKNLEPVKDNGQEEKVKAKIPTETNLFTKANIEFSSILPADYSPNDKKIGNPDAVKLSSTTEKIIKTDKSLQHLFSKTSVDISALLPSGYDKLKKDDQTETTATESSSIAPMTTGRPAGGIKLVFPSRPGGRKAVHKAAVPTHGSRTDNNGGASGGAVSPKIQKGWPVRATTEFTGWPTPSTTPISIEKLLEAARTATVASSNVSVVPITSTSSTTSTSTTTTTTQRPTTPGICEDECEVAGTIRIVGNATWVPELLDRNTQEWQLLAEEIEKEMNLVFVKSAVLKKWYKRVRIDGFSPGSILVDYFIELTDLNQRINTQELKVIFHDSLRTYNTDKWNETRIKGPIKLGAFSLDPKSTDFVVIPKMSIPQHIEADDRLIPQWAIAVIVIGVGGLLFIIVFGVSVLVNRQNASKLKPSQAVYTEEVAKNMIQASHGTPSHRSSQDYPKSEISTIWNDTTTWRDKSFESNSNEIGSARQVLVDGTLGRERHLERQPAEERKYNMYDSWRSEWNGYYYNPSHGSSKFAGYESTTNLSRHPPDYDTNF